MRYTSVNRVKGYSPKGEIKSKTRIATQNVKSLTVSEQEIIREFEKSEIGILGDNRNQIHKK